MAATRIEERNRTLPQDVSPSITDSDEWSAFEHFPERYGDAGILIADDLSNFIDPWFNMFDTSFDPDDTRPLALDGYTDNESGYVHERLLGRKPTSEPYFHKSTQPGTRPKSGDYVALYGEKSRKDSTGISTAISFASISSTSGCWPLSPYQSMETLEEQANSFFDLSVPGRGGFSQDALDAARADAVIIPVQHDENIVPRPIHIKATKPESTTVGSAPRGKTALNKMSASIKPVKERHHCDAEGCTVSCGRASDLKRHKGHKHGGHGETTYRCDACGYSQRLRDDKVRKHCKNHKHGSFSAV